VFWLDCQGPPLSLWSHLDVSQPWFQRSPPCAPEVDGLQPRYAGAYHVRPGM